jgi:hypothetical protein
MCPNQCCQGGVPRSGEGVLRPWVKLGMRRNHPGPLGHPSLGKEGSCFRGLILRACLAKSRRICVDRFGEMDSLDTQLWPETELGRMSLS